MRLRLRMRRFAFTIVVLHVFRRDGERRRVEWGKAWPLQIAPGAFSWTTSAKGAHAPDGPLITGAVGD